MNIEAAGLKKIYGKKQALSGLTFHLDSPKIVGLLGENGAGKSTLLQLLAGHFTPSDGQLLVDGKAPFNNAEVLQHICFVGESQNVKKKWKIHHALKFASFFYPEWSQETAERLLKLFRLEDSLPVKGLSKGMESALGITIGLASRAAITIFDEPYIGMDAKARHRFYDVLLEEFEAFPRTIILSTHLIDEVSSLFEDVMIMQDGQMLLHEEAAVLQVKAKKITGTPDAVAVACQNVQVLHKSAFMNTATAIVYDADETIESAAVTIQPCSLQELMVHLSPDESERASNE